MIETSEKYYKNKKAKANLAVRNSHKRATLRNKEYIKNYLLNHPCIDCGYSDIRALDFDHIIGIKLKNISDLVLRPCSIKTLQDEINKCEVRCSNCHRIVTHNRRKS